MPMFKKKEYKYYVRLELFKALRERFLQHMRHDPHCRDRAEQNYNVRSIYFDTPRLLFYYEKLDGLKIRKKLRIRTYNSLSDDSIAFFEIKRKFGNTILKERAKVPLEEAPNLMNGANLHLINEKTNFQERAALNKFIYLTKKLDLESQTLITYEREALFGIDDDTVRVTFDLNVRSYPRPDLDQIFREQDLRTITDKHFILEMKFYDRMPFWSRQILRDFSLRKQSISKYCNGLEVWTDQLNEQGYPE